MSTSRDRKERAAACFSVTILARRGTFELSSFTVELLVTQFATWNDKPGLIGFALLVDLNGRIGMTDANAENLVRFQLAQARMNRIEVDPVKGTRLLLYQRHLS